MNDAHDRGRKGRTDDLKRRLIRFVDRMAGWSPERRAQAHKAAELRLGGKHPRKRDAAIYAATADAS